MQRPPVTLEVAGDKSISHRALLLAALSPATSRLSNLNAGHDVACTAAALERCGVEVVRQGNDVRVRGGLLRDPVGVLHLGNSGTGVRLLAGLLAGAGIEATLDGDASLRSRPMDRIVEPLRAMGADVTAERDGRYLPLHLRRSALRRLDYDLPVASAQVKSCLLLAGLAANVPLRLRESVPTRDHTERLLGALGARLYIEDGELVLEPSLPLRPLQARIPGDISGAAFFVGLAVLVPRLCLSLPGLGLNPRRTAFLEILRSMGGDIRLSPGADEAGEPVGDLQVRHAGGLVGVDVPPALVPALIDEIPLLAVVASRARGVTRIRGAGELRLKESDRIASLAAGLRAVGGAVEELDDGLRIEGMDRPPAGRVETRLDHRVAMAFAVLGRVPGAAIELSETASIATSFAEFPELLARAVA
ncbi:MAG: 3-phosphoshikimate 1-carboxyvinyltransferase [Gemmatimonadetes bacterium]|nr:3-phosphoshikimate 1-carboxyvinyltransferase [Gemmatimonadota bacterium]